MKRISRRDHRRYVIDLLKRYELSARKSLGQHFLVSEEALQAVVDACEATRESAVVEIGPGIGNLTTRLAERCGRLLAVELDESFRPLHDKMTDAIENLAFLYGDALDWGWSDRAREMADDAADGLVVCGNIPYQITTPLILGLLKSPLPWRRLVFTVQKEVADRLTAAVGVKDYGGLTLKAALVSDIAIIRQIDRGEFFPPPNVDSTVIRLSRKSAPGLSERKEQLKFFRFVDGLFAHRRKQAPNSLSRAGAMGLNQEQWRETLEASGFDPRLRGEALSLDDALKVFAEAKKKSAPGSEND